jgi:hypothetical protein
VPLLRRQFPTKIRTSGIWSGALEGERILGANPCSKAASLQVQPRVQSLRFKPAHSPTAPGPTWLLNEQQYQNIDSAEGNIDGSTAWPQDTVLQFTSTQFPAFEAQITNPTTGWPFLETDMMYFDNLLNTDS